MTIFEKIKAALAVNSFVNNVTTEVKSMDIKSGWKTSEFWSKIAVQVTVLWGAIQGFVPPKWAAVIAVAGEAVYTIARTALKVVQTVQAAKSTQTTVTTTEPVTTVTSPT